MTTDQRTTILMKKLLAAAAALAATTATIGAGNAGAITNNYQVDNVHDFVGLMVALDDEGEFMWRCSGSLLDDQVTFLTAGHCTDDNAPDAEGPVASARIYFHQDAGANYDPATEVDPTTGYPEYCIAGDPLCVEASIVDDYGFDDFAGFPDTGDVGVVILDAPYTTLSGNYGTLAPVGTLDALFTKRGLKDTTFLASGYGLSYSSPVGAVSFRSRLMGYGKLTNLRSNNNGGFNLQTNGNGKGNGGTCSGDSGGPIFYPADSNQIVAVTSFGMNSWCRGVDFSYRVDRAEIQDWIEGPHPDDQ
jgi:hypothetical protein